MASDIPQRLLDEAVLTIEQRTFEMYESDREEMAGYVARALAEAEARGAERQWQPIETAPRDGSWIEVFCPSYIVNPVRPAQFIHDVGLGEDIWGYAGDGYEYPVGPEAPTHWQPLPAPPSIRNLEAKDGNPSS